jgi:hypothetical protein
VAYEPVACMVRMRNKCIAFAKKTQENIIFRPRYRFWYMMNIKAYFSETVCEGVDRILLFQNRVQSRIVVNMYIALPQQQEIF